MKEVKRYIVDHDDSNTLTPDNVVDREWEDIYVLAEDFDSIVKELEGKLKVAVEAMQRIEREGLRRMASGVCKEALAQIDLPPPLPPLPEERK